MDTFLRKYFSFAYFLLLAFLPLVFIPTILDGSLIPRQLLLASFCFFIVLSLLILKIRGRLVDLETKLDSFTLLMIGYLAINLISFANALVLSEYLNSITKTFTELLFIALTIHLLKNNLLNTKFLIAGVITMTGIFLSFAIQQIITTSTNSSLFNNLILITSTCGNKNLFSSILFLSIPFLIVAYRLNKYWQAVAILITLISGLLLTLLQTRSVWLALTFFLLFFASIYGHLYLKTKIRFPKYKYISTVFIVLTVCLLGALFLSFNFKPETAKKNIPAPQNKLVFKYASNTNTFNTRLLIWENSFKMFKEMPFSGVGPGNWQFFFPKYGLSKFDNDTKEGIKTFQRPHNDFVWVLCETGVLGLILYLLLFVIPVVRTLKKTIRYKEFKEELILHIALISSISGYCLIAFFDFPKERSEHQIILSLSISLLMSQFPFDFGKIKFNIFKKKSLSVILILIMTSLLFFAQRVMGEYYSRKCIEAQHKEDWKAVEYFGNKAISNFYYTDAFSIPISWYLGVSYFAKNDLIAAKKEFKISYKLFPYNIHVLNNLGSTLEKLNDHTGAQKYYHQALSISPTFAETLLNISASYYNSKEYMLAYYYISKPKTEPLTPKYKIYLNAILRSEVADILAKKNHFSTSLNDSILAKIHQTVKATCPISDY